MPTKPSHIQQEIQAETVTGHHDHPEQTENAAPVSGITDRQLTKKLSRTKSGGKRSKEKSRVSRETGPSIQVYDTTVSQHVTRSEDQQAPQQDTVVQPIDERSCQQQNQQPDTIQPVEENCWQQQNEAQLDERRWQEQQNAIQPVNRGQWQHQTEAQLDEHHWQEQQGMMQAANDLSWQQQTESHPPDDQQWQEQQSVMPAVDELAWQQQNQVHTIDEPTLHHPGMVEKMHEAGDSRGEMQLHSPSGQHQQLDLQENNGQSIAEHHAVDNNVNHAPHFSDHSLHGNFVQSVPIATGIKKVTKKKKKKKTKSKPALDFNTLPQDIFGIPFDQLDQVPAVENRHRESYQDQQEGPFPQLSVSNRVPGESSHVSRVAPELNDQHNPGRVVEVMEEIMDVDQQSQTTENQNAPPRVVDNEPVNFQSAHPVPTQTSGHRQSTEVNPRQGEPERHLQPQVATSTEDSIGRELHIHPERRRQEVVTDDHHRGRQHYAQHLPQPKSMSANDQVPQDMRSQGVYHHQEGGSERRIDPQHRAPHHVQPEKPSYVNEPIVQEIRSPQNRLRQDIEIVNHRRSSKHRAPRQTDPEELPHADEHLPQNLHAQQSHHGQIVELGEHRPVEQTHHRAPNRPQPLVARVNNAESQNFLAPSPDHDQQPVQIHEDQEQTQTHTEASRSIQQKSVAVNAQPATHRQGAQAAVGRIKSNRRSSRQPIVAPVTQPPMPVVNVPTITQASNAANEAQPNPGSEASSARADPVSGAFEVLQLTLKQDLQATIAKENEARRTLHSEIAELKVSEARLQAEVNIVTALKNELIETSRKDREKLKANSERLTKLHKFTSGINNDLAKEKQNAKALHQQITELVNEGKVNATERKQIHEQLTKAIETSEAVQRKFAKELTGTKLLIQKFELEKMSLEKELREKNQLLEDERDQRLRLADDVCFQAVDQQLMKQLINDSSASLLQKLSKLQLAVSNSKDNVTNQGVAELLQLVKALESRNPVSPDDLTGLKEQIDNLQNR